MCGRYTIIAKAQEIEKRFNVTVPQSYTARYNAAPSQILPVITSESPNGISFFQWGLIPHWAKDKSIGSKLINARAETLAEKPSFKSALKHRRCLVLADGFYEWKKTSKKSKTPYRISLSSRQLFAFAGLWEEYEDDKEGMIHSFTIITTNANDAISKIHERMPVILKPEVEDSWLSASVSLDDHLKLLQPFEPDKIKFHPVSTLVNSVANDDPRLIEEAPPTDQFGNLALFE